MKSTSRVATNQRLRSETAWRLLAAGNAPSVIGLLHAHLFENERRLPASILTERIGRDLTALRAEGHDLPQTAQTYLSQWLKDGFLERSYEPGANEEVYELSAAAIQAIRFVDSLSQKRTVATESRLSLVIQQLTQLAAQTATDAESRIQNLAREKSRIEAEIEALQTGHIETLPHDRALERVREILALADELANDFRQVREEFNKLNRQLREKVMESDGARGNVLEELFAGVDLVADSDAGRTFKAFWRLLTDSKLSMELEEALEQLLSREFSQALSRQERRFLSRMTRLLLERGGDVHEVLQNFARSLKQFVQSREYLEQRLLHTLIKEAQLLALELKDRIKPTEDIEHMLYLTSSKVSSLAQYHLYDPGQDRIDSGISVAGPAEISLESVSELVAQSEIDFRRLKGHVETVLKERDQASVADILEIYPSEQGLGSVVGYLALGSRHGIAGGGRDLVQWQGLDGAERQAYIPCIYFVKGCFNESTQRA